MTGPRLRYVRYWREGDPPSVHGRTMFEDDAQEFWLTAEQIRERGLVDLVCECERDPVAYLMQRLNLGDHGGPHA